MNNSTAITLLNNTKYAAQIMVKKEGQVVVFMPSVEPGQTVIVPSTDRYDIYASTVIDGNTFKSKTFSVSGATGFLAQVIQEYKQGTYVFDVQEVASTDSTEMQFQSTWRGNVTFTISKDGKELQNVVCADGFNLQVIKLGDTFSFQAIINGVTTDVQYTSNPNATCVASNDTTLRNSGYYTLQLS
jgi:hypothetical protein